MPSFQKEYRILNIKNLKESVANIVHYYGEIGFTTPFLLRVHVNDEDEVQIYVALLTGYVEDARI